MAYTKLKRWNGYRWVSPNVHVMMPNGQWSDGDSKVMFYDGKRWLPDDDVTLRNFKNAKFHPDLEGKRLNYRTFEANWQAHYSNFSGEKVPYWALKNGSDLYQNFEYQNNIRQNMDVDIQNLSSIVSVIGFDMDDVERFVAGKDVVSIELILQLKEVGPRSGIEAEIGLHNYDSAPSQFNDVFKDAWRSFVSTPGEISVQLGPDILSLIVSDYLSGFTISLVSHPSLSKYALWGGVDTNKAPKLKVIYAVPDVKPVSPPPPPPKPKYSRPARQINIPLSQANYAGIHNGFVMIIAPTVGESLIRFYFYTEEPLKVTELAKYILDINPYVNMTDDQLTDYFRRMFGIINPWDYVPQGSRVTYYNKLSGRDEMITNEPSSNKPAISKRVHVEEKPKVNKPVVSNKYSMPKIIEGGHGVYWSGRLTTYRDGFEAIRRGQATDFIRDNGSWRVEQILTYDSSGRMKRHSRFDVTSGEDFCVVIYKGDYTYYVHPADIHIYTAFVHWEEPPMHY